jgi:drug/metabolite transporter (DMT)-like permease
MTIALALACAAVFGVADYSGGRAARTAPSVVVTLIGQVASAALALVAVALIGTALPPTDDVMWGAAAGVAGAIALASFYFARSHGAMTVVAPITAVTSAALPVAFGLARGERPGGFAYAGMVIATIAIALACGAIGRRAERTDRTTIVFALVAGVGFAGILVALGETDEASGIWPLVAARLTSIAIVGGFVAATGTAVRGVGPTWKLASLAGVLDITANVLYLLAVQRGLLSVVVVVVALYPVSTLCLAFSLDKERVTGSQAIGIGLALGALVLVSVSESA